MEKRQPRRTASHRGGLPRTDKRIRSSDQIVRDIVRGLYEGRYVAGQRLVEPDVMRHYHVSRSTVREAITRLAAEGVVTVNPFRGAQIRQLSRSDARNVLRIMELLIGLAARLTAERIDEPGAREYFSECFGALMSFESERDSYDLVRARNQFYRAMTRIGGNKELDRLLPSFQVHLIRSHLRLSHEARFTDYRHIAEAIMSRDKRGAENAARAHIRRTAETLSDAPDDTFAPEETAMIDRYESEDTDNA